MTNREKYERFRQLYTGSDPHREDHRRFDRLVRLLLDLPENDPPTFKVGEFVKVYNLIGRVVAVSDDLQLFRVRFWDQSHRTCSPGEMTSLPALNEPIDEDIPF